MQKKLAIDNQNVARFVALQQGMANQIKWGELARLFVAYENDPNLNNCVKYATGDNLVRMSTTAVELGLDKRIPLRIADVGTGFGWFALALKTLGHEVLCLDGPSVIMEAGRACLGMNAVKWDIHQFEPIPAEFHNLDLISMMRVNLRKNNKVLFSPKEYHFLLKDFRSRLNPGGVIFILVNPPRINQTYQILSKDFWKTAVEGLGLKPTMTDNKIYFEMIA